MSACIAAEKTLEPSTNSNLKFPVLGPLNPEITSEVIVRLNCFTAANVRVTRGEANEQVLEIGGKRLTLEGFANLVRNFVKDAGAVDEQDPRKAVVALLSSAELNRNGHFDFPGSEQFMTPHGYMSLPLVGKVVGTAPWNMQPVELQATARGNDGSLNEGMYATPSHFPSLAVVGVMLARVEDDKNPIAELIRDIKLFKRTGSMEPIAGAQN